MSLPPPLLLLLASLLAGCLPEVDLEARNKEVYLPLELSNRERLSLAPHVVQAKARPTMEMVEASAGIPLRFRVLDKRTLRIYRLDVAVGGRHAAPWGGTIQPQAYVSDLAIREGQAEHGPEGHVNPVAWVALYDDQEKLLHEGWMFVRDSAQTAWDHPRFDLNLLGVVTVRPGGGYRPKKRPR